MTAVAIPPLAAPAARELPAGQVFVLRNATWDLYERLRDESEGQNIRITYDGGSLVLMSPLPIHDKVKTMAGRLIEMASFEMDVPISSFGSTTWKRKDLAKGLEADECYYVQNELAVHGRTDIDLSRGDPPPDLAVEIDITRNPADRQSVYAALGVREVWRYDGARFAFVRRTDAGAYEPIEASDALPFLTPDVIERYVTHALADEHGALKSFQQWLRTLHPLR